MLGSGLGSAVSTDGADFHGRAKPKAALPLKWNYFVSFRQGCVRPRESGFLLGQEAADGGSADPEPACDLGFADALPV
jgi:hypothetical protein